VLVGFPTSLPGLVRWSGNRRRGSHRERGHLGASVGSELGQNTLDMPASRALGNHQRFRDLAVGRQSTAQEADHLTFSPREFLRARLRRILGLPVRGRS
jgi:hypothetical protein